MQNTYSTYFFRFLGPTVKQIISDYSEVEKIASRRSDICLQIRGGS